MNATSTAESQELQLVDIIDLKWLLAGQGHHLHVERLQGDPAYARECLALADASPSAPARVVAARLRQRLGLGSA